MAHNDQMKHTLNYRQQ